MPTPTAEVQAAPVTAAVPIAPALEPAATPAREPQPPAPPSAAAEPRVAASPLPVPLGGGAGLSAVSIPGSLVLKYVATGESAKRQYSGEATLVWRHDGSAYEARLEMKVSLITARAMSSVGRITPEGLAPTRFGDRRFTEQAAHFDRPGARITFSNNAPAAAMLGGAQDRLSLLVQLGAMLAGDSKKFPSGTSIAVQTASDREASIWTFQVGETQTLQTPGGNVEAIKLTRKLRHEFDQKIELWLAPSLEYLPVRILQTEANGNFVDTRWRASERP